MRELKPEEVAALALCSSHLTAAVDAATLQQQQPQALNPKHLTVNQKPLDGAP